MNNIISTKINQLLSRTPRGIVFLSEWLKCNGYNLNLIRRYRETGWLVSIGTGADIRSGDQVDCYGAIYSLQFYANLSLHIGARSALMVLGKSHYLEIDTKRLILFRARETRLPLWFVKYNWNMKIDSYSSEFLPLEIGLVHVEVGGLSIKVSGESRALMECLYLSPNNQELGECYEFMESMNNIHPAEVQELLESCKSVKVKRLFLFLAEKIAHEWFYHLDLSKIDLGQGKRRIAQNGIFDKKYQITIPKDWGKND